MLYENNAVLFMGHFYEKNDIISIGVIRIATLITKDKTLLSL